MNPSSLTFTLTLALLSAPALSTAQGVKLETIPLGHYQLLKFQTLTVQKSKTGCRDEGGHPAPGLALVIKGAILADPINSEAGAPTTVLINPVECGERRTINAYRAAQILNSIVGNQGNYFGVPDQQVHRDIYAGFGQRAMQSVSMQFIDLKSVVKLEQEVEGEIGPAISATIDGTYGLKGSSGATSPFSFGVRVSNAENSRPVLMSLERPADWNEPGDPASTKIEVYSDGIAVKTVTHFSRDPNTPQKSQARELLQIETGLSKITECITSIDQAVFKVAPSTCQDSIGTHYRGHYGEKEFGFSACGKTQLIQVACARELINLLNSLDLVGRYQ